MCHMVHGLMQRVLERSINLFYWAFFIVEVWWLSLRLHSNLDGEVVFQKLFTAKKRKTSLSLSNFSILNSHSDSTAGKASWKEASAFRPSLRHTVDILTQVKKVKCFQKQILTQVGNYEIQKDDFLKTKSTGQPLTRRETEHKTSLVTKNFPKLFRSVAF